MGILGQQGTGRDLGRTQSDPDEGSIELALSGGAELQWAVWPTNRTDNTTAWGHLMAHGPLDARRGDQRRPLHATSTSTAR